jgi:hypothetical protein
MCIIIIGKQSLAIAVLRMYCQTCPELDDRDFHFFGHRNIYITKLNSLALVRKRTIPTERLPSVGEVNANFCG